MPRRSEVSRVQSWSLLKLWMLVWDGLQQQATCSQDVQFVCDLIDTWDDVACRKEYTSLIMKTLIYQGLPRYMKVMCVLLQLRTSWRDMNSLYIVPRALYWSVSIYIVPSFVLAFLINLQFPVCRFLFSLVCMACRFGWLFNQEK